MVDFKTTTISEEEPVKYKAQLQCYAMIMENPAEGSLKLNPVKNLGILCFDPGEITQVNETDCDFKMNTKWFNINRDDDELLSYITEVQDLLHQTKAPPITKSCKICEFREKIKMKNKKLLSETKSSEVIAFILDQYAKENIDRDLNVCAELVLISRIVMQRFRKNFGIDFKKNIFVEKAIQDVLAEIKKDKDFDLVTETIENYRHFQEKKLN